MSKQSEKCAECGQEIKAKINKHFFEDKYFCTSFCVDTCLTKLEIEKRKEEAKQKHEEIKGLAEKIYCQSVYFNAQENVFHAAEVKHCWQKAEDFYNYAKEREER